MNRAFKSLTDRKVFWGSFAIFLLLGGLYAAFTPLMGAPDEAAHTQRAVAVVRREFTWIVKTKFEGTDGTNPTRIDVQIAVPRAYRDLGEVAPCLATPPRRPADCAPPIGEATERVATVTSAGTYPPVPYVLTGWPSLFLTPTRAIYAMRMCNVVLCAAFFAIGLVAARRLDRTGVTLVGAAIGLTPVAFFLAGSTNPNGLEIAAAFAAWLTAMDLLRPNTPVTGGSVTRFALAASMLVLIRPFSPIMLAVACVVALIAMGRRERFFALLRDRKVRVALVGFGLASVASVAWLLYAQPYNAVIGLPIPGMTVGHAITDSLGRFPYRARQMVGILGWLDTPIPAWANAIWFIALGVLVVVAVVVGNLRQRLALLAVLAATILLPTLSEAPKAHDYGFIWQGRYSLPIAVGIPIIAAWIIGSSGRLAPRTVSRGRLAAVVGIGIVMIVSYMTLLQRFATGDLSPMWGFLTERTWSPPVHPLPVFVALMIVTVIAYGAWLFLLGGSSSATDVEDRDDAPDTDYDLGAGGDSSSAKSTLSATT